MAFEIKHGDCLDVMRGMADNSVDAIVTDPPYGLAFMGKKWDYDVPSVEVWAECLRVLKPGGHLLAFAGTRTQHRMAVRIEDAGFEIRDMIAWVYGSGFPKSLDVSKAIDKAAGAEREVIGVHRRHGGGDAVSGSMSGPLGTASELPLTAPATESARKWQGWGTALKPSTEPITVARKPLVGTVAENVLRYGTGALNIDGCRVGLDGEKPPTGSGNDLGYHGNGSGTGGNVTPTAGRWPANLIHDGSEEVVGLFPQTAKSSATLHPGTNRGSQFGQIVSSARTTGYSDTGSAARFFYCAKAIKSDRDEGLEHLPERLSRRYGEQAQGPQPQQTPRHDVAQRNHHPTVKPTALMRYLVRLVTPPAGTVLDPFTGSGSTGKAAILEGFRFIGCEREAEYVELAKARVSAAQRQLGLFA